MIAYDTKANKFVKCENLRERRMHHSATVINNKLYVTGGRILNGHDVIEDSDCFECYDPKTDVWTSKGSLPYKLFDHGSLPLVCVSNRPNPPWPAIQPATWRDAMLHARHLPFAMIYWPLITQMGNHFNLTAFRHAAQSLPQLGGMLGHADVHLNQRRAHLTARGVASEAPGNCGTELRTHEMTRGREYLHNKQLFRHIHNPKSSFRRWPHSFDGD